MTRAFQRTVEDFTCTNCGALVRGDGYTNHCPQCLFSKHVDVNPGDRLGDCGGLMQPIEVATRKGSLYLVHRCLACGATRRNRTAPEDSMEALLNLSKRRSYSVP